MEVMVMVMAEALVVAMKILSVNILGFILQLDAIGFEKKISISFFPNLTAGQNINTFQVQGSAGEMVKSKGVLPGPGRKAGGD